MKSITQMTRRDFEKIPFIKNEEGLSCRSLIILPSRISFFQELEYKIIELLSREIKWFKKFEPYQVINGMHESGYRNMSYIAIGENGQIIGKLSGISDVLHFDGIGGYGKNWYERFKKVPNLVEPSGWVIECLPKSGLLNVFCAGTIFCEPSYSSFEIFRVSK